MTEERPLHLLPAPLLFLHFAIRSIPVSRIPWEDLEGVNAGEIHRERIRNLRVSHNDMIKRIGKGRGRIGEEREYYFVQNEFFQYQDQPRI